MITETYAGKTPQVYQLTHKPAPFFTDKEVKAAIARKISPQEFVRRDNIVRDLYAKTKLEAGDTAYPIHAKAYEESGACIIVGVCKSLHDFSADSKWPKNDNPMIVSFHSVGEPEKHFVCTYDYLSLENRHLITC